VRDRIRYVGLDVHKEGIVAEGGRGEVREYGRIANTATAFDRQMRKLSGTDVRPRFCYEVGPCRYGIQRHVSVQGHECVMVGPLADPEACGRPDQDGSTGCGQPCTAASGGRADDGMVPDGGHETMRDLMRARLDAVHALRRVRQQLSGLRLRQGCHCGRPAWIKLHRRWLAGLKFEQPVHHIPCALDHTQRRLPMSRGRCGTMTHYFKRSGATTLLTARDVLDCQVIGQLRGAPSAPRVRVDMRADGS
jgi:transposase